MTRRTAASPLVHHGDPVGTMMQICDHFVTRAEGFDQKVEDAIQAGAAQRDIVAMMTLADDARMRALSAANSAAPYCQPKLSAVEISPASHQTQSRFDLQLEALSDDEIADALRQIEAGSSALVLLEATDQ